MYVVSVASKLDDRVEDKQTEDAKVQTQQVGVGVDKAPAQLLHGRHVRPVDEELVEGQKQDALVHLALLLRLLAL